MKQKILFVANITKHITSFHIPCLGFFKDNNFEVHVAANGNDEIPFCDVFHNVNFDRSPLRFSNFSAYLKLKKIINTYKYDIIHCHTPVGGLIARLAAIQQRNFGTKVLYTAHGFHFYKGASLKNWLLYYPVEKYLAKYTDHLITINQEDYDFALKKKSIFKKVSRVHGVGVDLLKFNPQTKDLKNELRIKYGFRANDFILLYAAEMNHGKHQDLIIDVVSILEKKLPNLKVLLAGMGPMMDEFKTYAAKKCTNDRVLFLGYRNDIDTLMSLSDVCVSASRREGLPINIVEAMAVGLSIVATNCRGNRELVINNKNGFLVGLDDAQAFAEAVEKIYGDENKKRLFALENKQRVIRYSLPNVVKELSSIYKEYMV